MKPISSSINVPCENLSKYIDDILKNIIELKERLENVNLDEEEMFVSFDVVSLFTNIPVDLAIYTIMSKWSILKTYTKISKKEFLKILNFCLKENNYFEFDGKIYKQIFGLPMGNPLSPTTANIILDELLNQKIDFLKNNYNINIKFLVKYVDDFFAIVKKADVDTILNCFNNFHSKIQFTVEKEVNKKLPFLDLTLHRQNKKIIFNWYTKPTYSGRIINFLSTQPKSHKINTANNLIQKVFKLSDRKFWHDNKIKIQN